MTVSYWQDKSIRNKFLQTDVTVIGGGIAGLSTCYWLLKEDPSLRVVLVEKNTLGSGASGRNAGFITCGSVEHFNRMVTKHGPEEALDIWNFSERNLELLKQEIITDDIAQDILFNQTGSFSLASTKSELEELIKSYEIMKDNGIEVELVNSEKDLETRLGTKGLIGGIKYVNDASVHPGLLLQEMEDILNEYDNFFSLENTEVFNIENKGDNKLIRTNKFNIESPLVIYATNAYTPLLDSYFSKLVFPTRGQIVVTEPTDLFMESPCYANFVLDYFRQLPTGEVLIGGFRQLEKDSEIGYSDEISPKIQDALEEFIKRHIPKAKDLKITHRWAGIMGFSFDGHPMIGSLPTDPNIFFNVGFTAHGLGLAFHTSKCLVDLIYGRPIPNFINGRRI
jgi:glycine/D-amino acid oxidase-like deaminating enzyme